MVEQEVCSGTATVMLSVIKEPVAALIKLTERFPGEAVGVRIILPTFGFRAPLVEFFASDGVIVA